MLNNSYHTIDLRTRFAPVTVEVLEQSRLNVWLLSMIAPLAAGLILWVGMTVAAAFDGISCLARRGCVCAGPLAKKYSWNGSYTLDGKHSRTRKYSWNSKYSWNGSIAWLSRLNISNMALAPVYWVTETP